jgi:hypothetical protein
VLTNRMQVPWFLNGLPSALKSVIQPLFLHSSLSAGTLTVRLGVSSADRIQLRARQSAGGAAPARDQDLAIGQ